MDFSRFEKWYPWIACLFFLLSLIFYFREPATFERVERFLLDSYFHIRGTTEPSEDIVIIKIDDQSIAEQGRWPWPRNQLATLLERLSAANPNLVVFDQIFSFDEREISGTAALAGAAREQKTIFPFYFETLRSGEHQNHSNQKFPATLRKSTLISFSNQNDPAKLPVLSAEHIHFSDVEIVNASRPSGHINIVPETHLGDNAVRWEAQVVKFDSLYFPSLALRVAAQFWGFSRAEVLVNWGQHIQMGQHQIPIEEHGWTLINYYGDGRRFTSYSAAEVLSGKPLDLQGKIAFVGVTAAGTGDYLLTPFTPKLPGVYKLATSASNILQNNALSRPLDARIFELLLLILIAALVLLLNKLKSKNTWLVCAFCAIILIFFIPVSAFLWLQIWLKSSYTLFFGGCILLFQFALRLQKQPIEDQLKIVHDRQGKLLSFAQFTVESEIGRGAMGRVYKAWDHHIERAVAIKEIKSLAPRFVGHDAVFKEARAAGNLSHKNIITILHVQETDTGALIIMEYIAGQNLEAIIQNSAPLSLDHIIAIALPLCDALVIAHKHGIIHHDLKPANILISRSGDLKLTDFGLAKILSRKTEFGTVSGTPGYMAPEQLRGEPVNHTIDLFALGVILFELATQQKPITTHTQEQFSADLTMDFSAIDVQPELNELKYIIMQLVHPNPQKRISNTETVQQLLQNIGPGELPDLSKLFI